jgi:hypothetical protein
MISGTRFLDVGTGDLAHILHSQVLETGLMVPGRSASLISWMLDSTELSSPMRSRYPGEEGMSPSPSDGIISGELWGVN